MKKILILLFLMIIPLFVKAETCDLSKISISSITFEEKSGNVRELKPASAKGNTIDIDLAMSRVSDSIKYKVEIKNESNNDYEIDKNSFNISSNYIDYNLESLDNSFIIKGKSKKTVYLKLEYKNEVPENTFKAGSVTDNKNMKINLSTNNIENNPKTGINIYLIIFIIILIISETIYILIRKKKYKNLVLLITFTSIIVPISVYAACNVELNINSNIVIDYLNSYFKVCDQYEYYMPYREGMKWQEYDDFIIENYSSYKSYIMNEQGELEEFKPLKKYGMDEDRIVLRMIQYDLRPKFEYSEHVLPAFDGDSEILFDNFFSFGKSKQEGMDYTYSYPNEFNSIENLETLYPDFYNEVSVNERWWFWNDNIFDSKYGCYYFNGG